MAKFRTFGIKVPKQTRSREIPDSRKATYKSPLTSSVLTRHLDFSMQEISKGEQCTKLLKSIKKAEKHLKNLQNRRNRLALDNPETSRLEYLIMKRKELLHNKKFRLSLLMRDLDTRDKRAETKRENIRVAEEQRQKSFARADKFLGSKPVSGANSNVVSKIEAREKAEALFLSKEKIIRSPKGGRKVQRNRHKTWSKT
jgi:hypothetical protein